MGLLHTIVLLRWPQLFGTTHLQVTMHSPGDCEPPGPGMHLAAAELQLYITGVGGGVGGGVHSVTPRACGRAVFGSGHVKLPSCRLHRVYWLNGREGDTPVSSPVDKSSEISSFRWPSVGGVVPVNDCPPDGTHPPPAPPPN